MQRLTSPGVIASVISSLVWVVAGGYMFTRGVGVWRWVGVAAVVYGLLRVVLVVRGVRQSGRVWQRDEAAARGDTTAASSEIDTERPRED